MELWERLAAEGSAAWNALSGAQQLMTGAVIVGAGVLALYLLLDVIKQAGKYLVLLAAVALVVHLCFPGVLCSSPWAARLDMLCR